MEKPARNLETGVSNDQGENLKQRPQGRTGNKGDSRIDIRHEEVVGAMSPNAERERRLARKIKYRYNSHCTPIPVDGKKQSGTALLAHLQSFLSLLSCLVLCLFSAPLFAQKDSILYAFRSFRTPQAEKMLLIGEIQSKSKESYHKKQGALRMTEYDLRPDRVIVKLAKHVDSASLKPGQKLYVVDKDSHHRNAHIVGEIELVSVFHSPLYGWLASGRGRLLRIRSGYFIAQKLSEAKRKEAFAMKRKGDYYQKRRQSAKAIAAYRKALELDASLPEAHVALGRLRYASLPPAAGSSLERQALALEAIMFFARAWRYRKRFAYVQEEAQYYEHYMKLLYDTYQIKYLEDSKQPKLVSYLNGILKVGKEAQQFFSFTAPIYQFKVESALARAHYYRMLYYQDQSTPQARSYYDESQRQCDFWLKQRLKQEAKDSELLRIALLFYYHRYQYLDKGSPSEQHLAKQLRSLILTKLAPYYKMYMGKKEQYDPKIEGLLRSL